MKISKRGMEYLQQFIKDKCVISESDIKIKCTLLVKEFRTYLSENKLSNKKIKSIEFKSRLTQLYPHLEIRKISVDHYIGITLNNYNENKTTRKMADRKRYLIAKFYNRVVPDDIMNAKDENGRKIYVRVGTYDRLYMTNAGLDPKNINDKIYYFKLFKQKLISFVFFDDESINWSETIKETHKLIEKYNQEHEIKIELSMDVTHNKIRRTVTNKNVGKEEVSDNEKVDNNEEEVDSDEEINNYRQRQKNLQSKQLHGYNIPIYTTPPKKDRMYEKEYVDYHQRLKVIARKVHCGKITPEHKKELFQEILNREKDAKQKWEKFQ